ncbi:tRNA (adenosine(37)-N6)-threonylcarbamoyltransferase complex ATPase subunit type 1 TsaE [Niabella ginsengisoli]|uniref:tRNA threonylcarbamoyladenosine biosynthesis protein TsaE n=1 Tax=Niabella ginsengisoli TaxID=522298 RepID=A0ABS9SEL6_9BACT|nr:tRNA (adenosine(37)-N6)-threonylcarbamoyltransferase complex ATPase subunit type 1 TsaE [Niabella ginsengisoli]MCH5596766.1 tRNA (adenosine(37)-N6)-threonylcarbamoyltransferase complex ATPase subunit type 1 TsaE [Niabella ginsengisoli]
MHATKKYALNDIKRAAEWLLEQINDHKVIALHGNMGAGKTTLVSAVCRLLKVTDAVSSPTFSIINEYNYDDNGADGSVYHIDLYRLKDEEEAIRAGVEDCLYSGGYCFVEWPERADGLLPPKTLHVHIRLEDDTHRSLEIAKN